MDNNYNILYIGPYNEESNRGRHAISNIRGLHKSGHQLKIVPVYYPGEKFKNTEEDILPLETKKISKYDICIQHSNPAEYVFNSNIKKNIGIFTPSNTTIEPIINTRLFFLDKIVVTSKKVLKELKQVLSRNILDKIIYCPNYIDLKYIQNYEKQKIEWIDNEKYYFYTELEFTEEYDWEKLLYVYISTFNNTNCQLIIKTKNIENDQNAQSITDKINSIAVSTNIKPNKNNTPRILNGIYNEKTTMALYNSIDCFIDCGRTHNYNNNSFIAAALGKDIICNSKLAASDLFENSYKVSAHPCNINYYNHQDNIVCSMYSTYYSMDTNDLKKIMIIAKNNKYKNKIKPSLEQYDISHINNLLC